MIRILLAKELIEEMFGPDDAVNRLRGRVADRTPGERLLAWLLHALVTFRLTCVKWVGFKVEQSHIRASLVQSHL